MFYGRCGAAAVLCKVSQGPLDLRNEVSKTIFHEEKEGAAGEKEPLYFLIGHYYIKFALGYVTFYVDIK